MTMKALILGATAALAATCALAAPAMAQDWRAGGYGGYGSYGSYGGGYAEGGYRPQPANYGYGYGFQAAQALRDRADHVQQWIDRARQTGQLSGWRAFHAQGDLNAIRRDGRDAFLRQGGLGPGQVAWLNGRLDHLAGYIRESGEGDGYGQRRW